MKPTSRQKKWRMKMKAQGRCQTCGQSKVDIYIGKMKWGKWGKKKAKKAKK